MNESSFIKSIGTSVADPDPGSGAFLTPGSGMGKIIGIWIRDEQTGSYFRELRTNFRVKIHKFFIRIWDPGLEKRIRDNHTDPQH
jgi:hypothetical protein